jgi:hypothetical protein
VPASDVKAVASIVGCLPSSAAELPAGLRQGQCGLPRIYADACRGLKVLVDVMYAFKATVSSIHTLRICMMCCSAHTAGYECLSAMSRQLHQSKSASHPLPLDILQIYVKASVFFRISTQQYPYTDASRGLKALFDAMYACYPSIHTNKTCMVCYFAQIAGYECLPAESSSCINASLPLILCCLTAGLRQGQCVRPRIYAAVSLQIDARRG